MRKTNNSTALMRDIVFQCALLLIFSLVSFVISANKSLWRDEAFSAIAATRSISQITQIAALDFSPPGYYVLLHYWSQLLTPNAITLRASSLVFSITAIALINECIFLLHQHLSKVKAKISVHLPPKFLLYSLVTINPLIYYFSAELRAYALLAMLITYSLIATTIVMQKKSVAWSIGLIATNLLLLYAHNLTIIWVIAITTATSIYAIISNQRTGALRYLKNMGLVFLGYLPWLSKTLEQTDGLKDSFWITFDPIQSIKEINGIFLVNEGIVSAESAQSWVISIQKIAIVISALIVIWYLSRHKKSNLQKKLDQLKKNPFFSGYAIALSSQALAIIGFYVFSLYIAPIMYARYFAMFSGISTIIFIGSLTIIYNKFKTVSYLMMGGYIFASILVLNSFVHKSSKVDYMSFNKLNEPIYTKEPLDILPCHFYKESCYFVGDITKTPRYIGASQITNIPTISDWTDHKAKKFYVLNRGPIDHEVQVSLQTQGYVQTKTTSIGEDATLIRFIKLQ